jgi:parvulin-like peptidyl-prolyl isomerase
MKLLYSAIAALLAVVAVIFAAGIFYDNVVRANQAVAQVGPDSISASQLLDEVRPQARRIDAQAKQLGGASNASDYVNQQKRGLPNQVLDNMIDTQLVAQEAARRGISVSSSEVDDKVRQTVASFNASTNPTPTPVADANASASPTPAAGSTPDLGSTPTAVPTLEDAAYGPALQQLLDQNSLTEPELRTILERSLLQDRVQEAIGQEQVPASQPQVHARQIVAPTADQANDLLTQLQNGADFASLAQQNSSDTATKASGGDMGWFGKGVQTRPVEDAVFALQPGQLSSVIQDPTGFHVLQVLESDPNRALPAAQLTRQRQKAFNDWLSSQRSGQDVKLSLDQAQTNWILSRTGMRP